jgi:hypothetical protein
LKAQKRRFGKPFKSLGYGVKADSVSAKNPSVAGIVPRQDSQQIRAPQLDLFFL